MKPALFRSIRGSMWPVHWSLILFSAVSLRAESVSLSIKDGGSRVEISWPTAVTNTTQDVVFPEFELSASANLKQWYSFGPKLRGMENSGPRMSYSFEVPGPMAFFRVTANLDTRARHATGDGGAESFGYNARFAKELLPLGWLSLENFVTNSPAVSYLPQLSWDPTTALFWTNFYSTDLHSILYNSYMEPREEVQYNYRLNPSELPIFLTNGFVVCERMGTATFGDAYYRLFNADLPVFISCDSVLHAWHRSYQSMLEETEELVLFTLVERMLDDAATQLPGCWAECKDGPLATSVQDADYFLTVARSLLGGSKVSGYFDEESPKITQTLADIAAEVAKEVEIFGSRRTIDFSQFKVRGHYEASARLRQYFKAMMWLGRVDLRVATFEPNRENDIRQLGTAIVLQDLLNGPWWTQIDKISGCFVGVTDSMTPPQLRDLLSAAVLYVPQLIQDFETLTNLQTTILTGSLGAQDIHGDAIFSPFGPEQVKLARSFTASGQKFVVDSWAMSQLVFDRILWEPEAPGTIFGKMIRRKPSCLDVAYSVLGNDAIVADIVRRIADTNGVPFRDGLPYQHNLLAVRKTLDGQQAAGWTNNIYAAWLGALRALSAPTTDPEYPQVMRTRAWAMKNLNTQLASWSQLRHDTILYAKQSYTEPVMCSYPAGFLEPRPEFWAKMKLLADVAASAISQLPLSGTVTIPRRIQQSPFDMVTFDLAQVQQRQLQSLANFSSQMATLHSIAVKELAQQPLNAAETGVFENVVERFIDYVGERHWTGWYPALFYFNAIGESSGVSQKQGCDVWDPLVTDVHTDLPDEIVGDPGAVIHEGVGNVHLMLIAIDNGPDGMVYAGPVFSHYEFEAPVGTRLTDSNWQNRVRSGQQPESPEWTHSYLVPGKVNLTGY